MAAEKKVLDDAELALSKAQEAALLANQQLSGAKNRRDAAITDLIRRDTLPVPFVKAWRWTDRRRFCQWKLVYDRRKGFISIRRAKKHYLTFSCSGGLWWNFRGVMERVDSFTAPYLNVRRSGQQFGLPILVSSAVFRMVGVNDDWLLESFEGWIADHAAFLVASVLPHDLACCIVGYVGNGWLRFVCGWDLLNDENPLAADLTTQSRYPESFIVQPFS